MPELRIFLLLLGVQVSLLLLLPLLKLWLLLLLDCLARDVVLPAGLAAPAASVWCYAARRVLL